MDVKFRNRQIKLSKLDPSKVNEIVSNAVKQKEEQYKKILNDKHIEHIMNELKSQCQNDVNNKIYETTLQTLMEQYETICKPTIEDEIKKSLYNDYRTQFEQELRQSILHECRMRFEQELKEQIRNDCKTKIEEELRQTIFVQQQEKVKKQIEKDYKKIYIDELKKLIENEYKEKMIGELKQSVENEYKESFIESLKYKTEKNTVSKINNSKSVIIRSDMVRGIMAHKLKQLNNKTQSFVNDKK